MSQEPSPSSEGSGVTTPTSASASGDPFYVFKEELESKVSSLRQRYSRWKSAYEDDSSLDFLTSTKELKEAVDATDKSLQFLEQTIVTVESNRTKFEHIDSSELASRKAFVTSTRKEVSEMSKAVSSASVQSRVERDEHATLVSSAKPSVSKLEPNRKEDNFFESESRYQQQLMQEQDESLDGLSTSVARLNHVAVGINTEVKSQNKMLDNVNEEVDDASDRMNVVMARMSRLLQTKDKCQMGVILVLVLVLAVLVFLVIYT